MKTCDWAGCTRAPVQRVLGFEMCPEHVLEHHDLARRSDIAEDLAPKTKAPTVAPAAGQRPVDALLEKASGHPQARVNRLAEKIEKDLGQLRALLARHDADEERRRAEAAAREAAKAEVERLENELRRARAALRGNPVIAPEPTEKPKRQYSEESLARMRENAARMRQRAAEKKAAGTPQEDVA